MSSGIRQRHLCLAAFLTIVILPPATDRTRACGPYFPNQILTQGDDALLWAPVADFHLEIERLCPADGAPFKAVVTNLDSQTADVDRAELESALKAAGVPTKQRDNILAAHAEVRRMLTAYAEYLTQVEEGADQSIRQSPPPLPQALPQGLPPEFAWYLSGAIAYRRGETETARQHWNQVLALPPAERKYRSTWAAYMLGRMDVKQDPARAVEALRQVRALAQAGYIDGLGLAAASLGWEAKAELNRGRFEQAIELYLQQLATGDSGATASLRLSAEGIVSAGKDAMARAARHEPSRRVLTAYVLANGGPRQVTDGDLPDTVATQWLDALEHAKVDDLRGADRLAWLAYRVGRTKTAERWLARADKTSGITAWIRAKLLMRAGKLDEAAAELSRAIKAFPENEEWQNVNGFEHVEPFGELNPGQLAGAELGALRLTRRQYVDALDALMEACSWLDAGYVAERVLTIQELQSCVDRRTKEILASGRKLEVQMNDMGEWPPGDEPIAMNNAFRHLLARRLARQEKFAEARPYMPREFQPRLDEFAAQLKQGRSKQRSRTDRAASLWAAARIAREHGLDLLGSELDPDWFALGGSFQLDPVLDARLRPDNKLNRASTEEKSRVADSAVTPSTRWHYRYIAADLGWQAAELMPDNAEETAKVLNEAGSWIKITDPKKADQFYKALVRRCGNTTLGREAARRRWFAPTVNE